MAGNHSGNHETNLETNGISLDDPSLLHLIKTSVTSKEIQVKLKDCLDELKEEGKEDQGSLLKLLKERGLIEDVMASLQLEKTTAERPMNIKIRKRRQRLSLHILSGKAFVDHLQEAASFPLNGPIFSLHVYFNHQRHISSPVPCSCEPNFNEVFLFELPHQESDLLTSTDLIHIILTKTTLKGDTHLVGTFLLDWRSVLTSSSNKVSKSIELVGPKVDARIPPGVLILQWELLQGNTAVIDLQMLEAQCQLERQRETERKRLFLLYAKQWWAEYVSSRAPTNSQRLVKIFAEDERGDSHLVCHYITHLKAGRSLESPRHAARFVSLINHREEFSSFGKERKDCDSTWQSMATFLATKSGSCEDHSVLLCSLLLGYGLDAYVCIGTKNKGQPHCWVMTCNKDGSVIFWESITGQRFHQPVCNPDVLAGTVLTPPTHHYHTIGCVFNHNSLYANNQPSDCVFTCQFNLHNKASWKRLSSDTESLLPQLHIPLLVANTLNGDTKRMDLEEELKVLWLQHRLDCGLTTQWDNNLSYLLGPALYSYELERKDGVSVGLEEFQEAIRRHVPEGHTFKGFPMQFSHFVGHKIFVTCLKSQLGGDIINCHGDCVRLGLHVKVYTYPENVCAVWCMLAVTYQSIL